MNSVADIIKWIWDIVKLHADIFKSIVDIYKLIIVISPTRYIIISFENINILTVDSSSFVNNSWWYY